jgi:hypothetical protein
MFQRLFFIASVLALAAAQSQAAVLQLDGPAFVDTGLGFKPAANNMHLKPGDRVRAGDGCVVIIYDTGYQTRVCNGRVAAVLSDPPQPVGPAGDTPAFLPESGSDPIVAGLITATGVGLTVAIANSGNHPASP